MSTAAFIRGDASEVKLSEIIPQHLQGSFMNKARQESIAAEWEKNHPATVVVRPWEEVPDELLPLLSPEERADAIASRKRLDERRSKRKNAPEAEPLKLGGDPERMARELQRVRLQLSGLDPEHAEYDKLFSNYVTNIHELEAACGLPQTDYTKGQRIERPAEVKIDPDVILKFGKWKQLPREKKLRSIEAGQTPKLLELIRDDKDSDEEMQKLAVERLMQLGAIV